MTSEDEENVVYKSAWTDFSQPAVQTEHKDTIACFLLIKQDIQIFIAC